MAAVAHDDVVEKLYFEQLAGTHQVSGGPDVGLGWAGIATRMVVHHDDGVCRGNDCRPEGLPAVDQDLVQQAGRDQLMALHPATGVEQQNHEAFPIGIKPRVRRDVQSPVRRRTRGSVAQAQVFGSGAVAQGDHLVLLGIRWAPLLPGTGYVREQQELFHQ